MLDPLWDNLSWDTILWNTLQWDNLRLIVSRGIICNGTTSCGISSSGIPSHGLSFSRTPCCRIISSGIISHGLTCSRSTCSGNTCNRILRNGTISRSARLLIPLQVRYDDWGSTAGVLQRFEVQRHRQSPCPRFRRDAVWCLCNGQTGQVTISRRSSVVAWFATIRRCQQPNEISTRYELGHKPDAADIGNCSYCGGLGGSAVQ